MSPADAVWEAWRTSARRKALARRYYVSVLAAGGGLADLFRNDVYEKHFRQLGGDAARLDARAIRDFLRILSASVPELKGLALPRIIKRRRPLRKIHPNLLIEQFARTVAASSRGAIVPELSRLAAELATERGVSPTMLSASDFARVDVASRLTARLRARPGRSKHRGLQLGRTFLRQQAEASGLAPAQQAELLQSFPGARRPRVRQAWSPLVERYIYEEYLSVQRHGWRSTGNAVYAFEKWALNRYSGLVRDDYLSPGLLRAENVEAYIDSLEQRRIGSTSRARYLACLRRWFRWLAEQGYPMGNALRPLRRVSKWTEPDVKVWPLENVLAFRDAVMRDSDALDKAVFGLLVTTVCRSEEIWQLTLDDWDSFRRTMRFHDTGQDGEQRYRRIPVFGRVATDVDAYLTVRPLPRDPLDRHLFIYPDGTPVTQHRIRARFIHYCTIAGLPSVRVGLLRNTGATELLDQDVDTFTRARILGHLSLNSQTYYTKFTFAGARKRLLEGEEDL